jgi:hypothetical protein
MDRFVRPSFALGFGLFLAATGCRSTQPEVPPGRPFAADGKQRDAIQFSSQGHPPLAQGSAPYMPNNLGGSDLAAGMATPGMKPDGSSYGGPPGQYGAPGTAGSAPSTANLSDPSTVRTTAAPASIPLTGTPPPGTPPINLPPLGDLPSTSAGLPPATSPDLNVTPAREAMPSVDPIAPPSQGQPPALPNPM